MIPAAWAQRWQALGAGPVVGPLVRVFIAYVVLIEIGVQLVYGRVDIPFVEIGFLEVGRVGEPLPRELFINGAVIGALYGLVAVGLILVYRANRIINFAQAQLGAVAATVALMLIAFKGWPYATVIPIVIIGAAILGGLIEVVFVRRFATSPRLILTVATIGIGLVLQAIEFFSKEWLTAGNLVGTMAAVFSTPFSGHTRRMGVLTFSGDHLVAVGVVLAVAIGLGAFFRFTDIGIAVRASAENADRAALLGIPVKRVSTIVWIIAAVISSLGVFLRAPLVGISITGFVGPSLLLYGLAAAVIARMESMPLAIFAGMGVGIVEASAVFSTNRASLASPAILVVLVVALLAQRAKLGRAHDTGVSTWQASRDLRPIPSELRDLPVVRRARRIVGLVLVAGVVATPWIVGDSQTGLATNIAIFSIIGVSLVVLTGWTGQISLGQFALAGIGSAVAGGLAANHNVDFFVTLLAAGLAGAAVAILIGLPALRIQGLFLAVTTLAFAFTVSDFVLRREWFGWLLPKDQTFVERPVLYSAFDMSADSRVLWFDLRADAKFFYLCVVFLGLALFLARSLRRYRSGRILIGIRDNSRVMQAFGVNLARTRLTAFAMSGFLAAIAGALLAYQRGSVSPDGFLPQQSITIFLMTVIGGISSLPGAVLGAVYVLGLPLLPVLREIELIELLTSGIGVLLLLQVMPGGLIEGVYGLRDSWLRRVAEREGIHVPSLVADSLVEDEPRVEVLV